MQAHALSARTPFPCMLVTPQLSRDTCGPLCLGAVRCAAPLASPERELSHTVPGTAAGTAQGAEEVLKDCGLPSSSQDIKAQRYRRE